MTYSPYNLYLKFKTYALWGLCIQVGLLIKFISRPRLINKQLMLDMCSWKCQHASSLIPHLMDVLDLKHMEICLNCTSIISSHFLANIWERFLFIYFFPHIHNFISIKPWLHPHPILSGEQGAKAYWLEKDQQFLEFKTESSQFSPPHQLSRRKK